MSAVKIHWADGISREESTLDGVRAHIVHSKVPGEICRWNLPPGSLTRNHWITFDLLAETNDMIVFRFRLFGRETEKPCEFHFSVLPRCQARVRFPLTLTDQSRWRIPREGAWLKPTCYGEVLPPPKCTLIVLDVLRQSPEPARWRQTELRVPSSPPQRLSAPLLPEGPLVDSLGQSTHRNWVGKTMDMEELAVRLRTQQEAAAPARWPEVFSAHGGWKQGPQLEATGFFRVVRHENRWWFVDPGGCLFWSAGLDCVRATVPTSIDGIENAMEALPSGPLYEALCETHPEAGRQFDHLAWNFHRVFGPEWKKPWDRITAGHLRSIGFNTVANWSDANMAREQGIPRVLTLKAGFPGVPRVFRDFPDVFDPRFETAAEAFAKQLLHTRDDPNVLGYFLMNEPVWGFASLTPAEGMLLTPGGSKSRDRFACHLNQHPVPGLDPNLVLDGTPVPHPLSEAARQACVEFSAMMVEKYFRTLNDACRRAAPNHLNLGIRYFTVPPEWCLAGMRGFDVFSINCYKERPPASEISEISRKVNAPVLIGEWHFGALDAGLPGSGIGHVSSQTERGKAYRVYLEHAAAHPDCVGAHYFTLYDESFAGRFDGENWNIGFLDVCNRPYPELCEAASASHARLYEVASGSFSPYNEPVTHLPLLFC